MSVVPANLYEAYGLSVVAYFPMQSGYRNSNYPARLSDGTFVNLIMYKAEPGMRQTLDAAHYVAEYLHCNHVPARHLYEHRILRIQGSQGLPRLAAVYGYLPGDTIPWEAYTMEHLKVLGGTMGRMHKLLVPLPQGPLSRADDIFNALLRRMSEYFDSDGVRSAMCKKLGLYPPPSKVIMIFQHLFVALAALPEQPLHLDFVRGNLLFCPGTAELTGILDFEKAAYGNVLYDISRTFAFLLVDCKHKTKDQVRKYFLKSGYAKRGGAILPNSEILIDGHHLNAFELLVDFFLLHDFYKFLKHNPYEALMANEHYCRTRDLLLERQLLRRN